MSFLYKIESYLKIYRLESILVYIISSIATFGFIKKYKWNNYKNDTNRIYIFGSGYSLNNISKVDWLKIRKSGHTLSFSEFFRSDFVDVDFHIIREIDLLSFNFLPFYLKRFFGESILNLNYMSFYYKNLKNNKRFKNTRYIFLCDLFSGPSLLFYCIYGYFLNVLGFYSNKLNRKLYWPISESLKGIPHGNSTLLDCINIAYLMGYKEIILVGVDMYDRRYFYLKENESREYDLKIGRTNQDLHNTSFPVLEALEIWYPFLLSKDVKLYSLNEKSLLTKILPVFNLNLADQP